MRLRGKLLKKNSEFLEVYQHGKAFPARYCVLYFLDKGDNNTRVGISVSKKVGNSVVRHRQKRLYKEIFRLHQNLIKAGVDMVIIVRRNAATAGFHQCRADLMRVLERAGLYGK